MSQPRLEHPEELLPWHVNGTLEGNDKRQVEEHLRFCLACRRQVQELQDLQTWVTESGSAGTTGQAPDSAAADSSSARSSSTEDGLERLLGAVHSSADGPHASRTQRGKPSNLRLWLPLAAAVIATFALGSMLFRQTGEPNAVVRSGSAETVLRSSLPSGQVLTPDRFVLRWQAEEGWQGARFSVFVTTLDLRPVATVRDLATLHFQVAASALDDLAPSRLLWRVEATHPDGRRASSPTFSVELGSETQPTPSNPAPPSEN